MKDINLACFQLTFILVFLSAMMVAADPEQFTLEDVILDDNTQMSGTLTLDLRKWRLREWSGSV